jgi:hypothetical protein
VPATLVLICVLLPGKKFASPKSSILGLRFLSKENIARFDVTVDDWWMDFFVKVGEPISNTNAIFTLVLQANLMPLQELPAGKKRTRWLKYCCG